jgi:hypothetical protein
MYIACGRGEERARRGSTQTPHQRRGISSKNQQYKAVVKN